MSLRLWTARLSEGWCPRPEHPRFYPKSDSGHWCVPCQAHWTIRDRMPVAELVRMFTREVPLSVELTLTEETAEAVLAEIEEHGRRQHEAAMKLMMPMTPRFSPFGVTVA